MSAEKDIKNENKRKALQEEDGNSKFSKVSYSQMDEIRRIWSENPELLLPVEYEDNDDREGDGNEGKFYRALELVFDVDPRIIDHICNRDHLEFTSYPTIDFTDITPNFFQILNFAGEVHDSIDNTIRYLFFDTEIRWGEPYDFNDEELKLRKEFHKKREQKYTSIKQYFDRISIMLFRDTSIYHGYKDIL